MTADRRPRVVAIGGGHGTAVTIEAGRRYASVVTAIVSVADDGGSSGRLREALGIPAPGDLRRCLVALSDDSPLRTAFDHRFDAGDLAGHPVGNILIAGLTVATGDFVRALEEAARLLGVTDGCVLPATCDPVVLKAEAEDGTVHGQVNVAQAGRIIHVSLVPPDPEAPAQAVEAILDADQVVLGPGSLFTSVVAAVAVPALREALGATPAQVVYLCNLSGSTETVGYDVAAHVDALVAHGVTPGVVVYDPEGLPVGCVDESVEAVAADVKSTIAPGHDPQRLAKVLARLADRHRNAVEPGQ